MASASIEPKSVPALAAAVIVVMGVSGCGKTTVAQLLAQRLQLEFVEGDSFHPEANIAKMRAGIALTDTDRQSWLQALAARLCGLRGQGRGAVLSCSALKRAYRDVLRSAVPDLHLLHLAGEFDLLSSRLAARNHHYMPASLLRSQFADLQLPQADERAQSYCVTLPAQDIAERFCKTLYLQSAV